MIITPVSTTSAKGKEILSGLRDRFQLADSACQQTVTSIIADIRQRGDEALIEYIRKFDAPKMSAKQLRVSEEELHQAMESVDEEFLDTLELAIERIYTFHEREKEQSWMVTREDGAITGRLVHPVDSAGLYVPGGQGGKTPLVSSVLMNGIPAAIAGVERRVMMTPPDENGTVNPALLVAAQEIGITEIYKAGSAWAIAALAYGTKTITPVDVIVGPGNQYVTEAKRQVSGRVRIDMIAGPSEVLIIADETGEPSYIAADMLAQAEHDPLALAMCITTSEELAGQIVVELKKQLADLSRSEIARKSLSERGVILVATDLEEAILLANQIAAEHLELMVSEPFLWLTRVRHAGAIFLGRHTPESAGDYLAGPNHVLPTMGTARFSSALGVETFIKKSSLIAYSQEALQADSGHIQLLAKLEGLTAHANSVAIRTKKK
ncbi:MAG: histidinol dehydrogenase [Desulfurivibrionaceae bacterium]|jgi:histidinol dehydrogenase|nr:histidinol dehydrogenase [Pseudomonadota bacterium]MCG2822691.1 histidinol dehydrogenase [Desulfobulbaceae bacterium]MDP2003615.1 histidinol dehydrogenase [Desulfurivibrionaceae bacterium]PKN22338.1 MAG: histidinol dehydrogenase [Deltaproteobacteria bacterium HGW-Deltaproteobacteria-3]MBU4407547.1 histidinol dehydrogenase [Pseudomonadota bacterium]